MRRAVRGIVFRGNELLVIKRNKFGKLYYTLPGGGMGIGETVDLTLAREMAEETGVQLGNARLVFIEEAGDPYGTQYIYLVDYVGGEPHLSPSSDEASITALGQNLYEPTWLPLQELESAPFISERLKRALLKAIKDGFPEKPITID